MIRELVETAKTQPANPLLRRLADGFQGLLVELFQIKAQLSLKIRVLAGDSLRLKEQLDLLHRILVGGVKKVPFVGLSRQSFQHIAGKLHFTAFFDGREVLNNRSRNKSGYVFTVVVEVLHD